MTTIRRTILPLLLATMTFSAAIALPASARVRSHVSEQARAAHAQAYPGSIARSRPNAVYSPGSRSMGSDPDAYIRIEESKDCHLC